MIVGSLTEPSSLYSSPLPSGIGKKTLPACGAPGCDIVSGRNVRGYSAHPPAGTLGVGGHAHRAILSTPDEWLVECTQPPLRTQQTAGAAQARAVAAHPQVLGPAPEVVLDDGPQLPRRVSRVGQHDGLGDAGAHVAPGAFAHVIDTSASGAKHLNADEA